MGVLFRIRGSIPFMIAMFLNAFVDLGHKIIIQNTIFKIYDGQQQIVLTAIINALILIPFILLLSPAGFFSDRYPKRRVMRLSAWVAVGLTLLVTLCYYLGLFWLAFAMTLLLSLQSAIYSPAKFGLIRPLFGTENLARANGIAQAVSICAILLGTLVFSLLFEMRYSTHDLSESDVLRAIAPLGWMLVLSSLLELWMCYQLPEVEQGDPTQRFDWRAYSRGRLMCNNLRPMAQNSVIRLSIIGLATFWAVGQVLLAAFPEFTKSEFGIHNTLVIQGILACAGLGIAFGSTLAGHWSRDHIETGLIPLGALGIALGLYALPHASSPVMQGLCLFWIGMTGGIFMVPLNALIQFHCDENKLGRILALNNWVQNVAMLSFLVLTVVFALLNIHSRGLLVIIAYVALIGCGYTVFKLPQSLVRMVLVWMLSRHYRVKVQGIEHLPNQGGVLLLGNHISWVDWAILQIAVPRPIRFVMQRDIYERWYLHHFLKHLGCIPIDSGVSSRSSLQQIAKLLDDGEVVCLFPEGAISRTGHLGKFRGGFELTCQQCSQEIALIPFYLRGLWGSQFSRSSDRLKRMRSMGWRRELIVSFGSPLNHQCTTGEIKRRVFDLSVSSWQQYTDSLPTLGEAIVEAQKRVASEMSIADTFGTQLSGYRALTGALCLARRIRKLSPEDHIGLLLPTSAGGILGNMAGVLAQKTLVNLNYTASAVALNHAIEQARIKTIYTSRRFLKKLSARGVDLMPLLAELTPIYLEDLNEQVRHKEKLATLLMVRCFPTGLLKWLCLQPCSLDDTAAILFSSGSEGMPKGVMLSQRNIIANVKQISDVLNTQDDDVIMASLPLFHAFGLTVTQFLPLIEGLPLIAHADPTDALGVAKAVSRYRATLMCGTATFLRLYARNKRVHPLMFDSLRLVVAGAEKLSPDVSRAFSNRFHKPILEGYGTTETTPVASVNLPDALDTDYWQVQLGSKLGTVGMPLPGTSFRIVDPDTWQELPQGEAGMILIGGAQVMLGYLNQPELTERVIKIIDGVRWYVTGDKGYLDKDGFLTIVDRYSRFAKIAGEMISLSALEQALLDALGEEGGELVAVNLPDTKKGEQILLLHERDLNTRELSQGLQQTGLNPLMLPAHWMKVDRVPKLGSGKTDYAGAKALAESCLVQMKG